MIGLRINSLPHIMYAHACTIQDIKGKENCNIYFELTFIEEGRLNIKSELLTDNVVVEAGDFFFAPAGYRYSVSVNDNLKHSCVAFLCDCEMEIVSENTPFERYNNRVQTVIESLHIPVIGKIANSRSYDLMQKIVNECKKPSNEYSNVRCSSYIIDLLLSIAEVKPMEGDVSGNYYYYKKMRSFLETNYANPDLDMASVAEYMGLHLNYLSGIYKKVSGSTVMKDLKKIRISMAKKLLKLNKYFVKDVATMVGFRDVNYFSVVFKKEAGVSPEQYGKSYE